jgi:hypothetical protein
VIQTQSMNAALGEAPVKPLGFWATGAKLVREEGKGRLWRGFSVAALRGIPGASSTFLAYSLVSLTLTHTEGEGGEGGRRNGVKQSTFHSCTLLPSLLPLSPCPLSQAINYLNKLDA